MAHLTFEEAEGFGLRVGINGKEPGRFDKSDSFQMDERLVNCS